MPTPVISNRPTFRWDITLTGSLRLVQTGGTQVRVPEIVVPYSTSVRYRTALSNQISLAYYYGSQFADQLKNYADTGVDFQIVILNNRNHFRYGQDAPSTSVGGHVDPNDFTTDLGSNRAVNEKLFGPDFTIYVNGEVLNTNSPSFESALGCSSWKPIPSPATAV